MKRLITMNACSIIKYLSLIGQKVYLIGIGISQESLDEIRGDEY